MNSADALAPATVGKHYDETAILPFGREETIAVEVVAADEAGRCLVIEASLSPVLPTFEYRVEATQDGNAHFYWRCAARGKGVQAALGRRIMPLVLKSRLERALGNLQRILEDRPGTTMRSAHFLRFGGARERMIASTEAAVPQPGESEVLVRQHASSVNMIDCHRRSGYGRRAMRVQGALNFPVRLGNDIAGVVVECGEGVTKVAAGDAVLGVKAPSSEGAFADYVVVSADQLIRKPGPVSFTEAAALPYTFITAWSALVSHGGLTKAGAPGKRVFVQGGAGGAGGVGAMAVQIARAWGAYVAATCAPGQVEIVRKLGADRVIDYTVEDFASVLSDYDLALCTATTAEQDRMISILKRGGGARYVTVIHPTLALTDELDLVKGMLAAKRQRKALNRQLAADGRRAEWALFKARPQALADLAELLANGAVRPVIDSTYPLSEIAAAMERLESGAATGKIVIDIAEDDPSERTAL
jgi:NADPH:quinone reductase-like Zn-dependent oxidoreductase